MLFISLPVSAQVVTNDQETLRQQERERALRRQQEPQADVRLSRPDDQASEQIPALETPCDVINNARQLRDSPCYRRLQSQQDLLTTVDQV